MKILTSEKGINRRLILGILPIHPPRRILHKYVPLKERNMDRECSTHGTNYITVSFINSEGRSRQVGGYIAR
jgi:hypothetical protein